MTHIEGHVNSLRASAETYRRFASRTCDADTVRHLAGMAERCEQRARELAARAQHR